MRVLVWWSFVCVGVVGWCGVVSGEEADRTCVKWSDWSGSFIGAEEMRPGVLTACFDFLSPKRPWTRSDIMPDQGNEGCLDIVLKGKGGKIFARPEGKKVARRVRESGVGRRAFLGRVRASLRLGLGRVVKDGDEVRLTPPKESGMWEISVPMVKGAQLEWITAVWSPKGSSVAVVWEGANRVEVWDRSGALRGVRGLDEIKSGDYQCGEVAWLSDRLLLGATDVCAGPGGKSWVWDVFGSRKSAVLGGAKANKMNLYGASLVRLRGDVWVFVTSNGDWLVSQNMKTGRVLWARSLERYLPRRDGHAVMLDPSDQSVGVATLSGGRVAVIFGGVRGGDVLVLDGRRGSLLFEVLADRCGVVPRQGEGRPE